MYDICGERAGGPVATCTTVRLLTKCHGFFPSFFFSRTKRSLEFALEARTVQDVFCAYKKQLFVTVRGE